MGAGNSPCASCRLLRRRCAKDCIFAPYFPSDAIVHKVFGASNISKMLQDISVHQKGDAVSSLVYEAKARGRDPVYGCVGAISCLQNQVAQLQMQLAVAEAEILCIQMQQQQHIPTTDDTLLIDHNHNDNSYFLQNNLFTFTSPSANVIYDSFKKESLCGHDHIDMVS